MASSPSAAKWNILGTNDASFNDGTGIFGLYKNLLAVDSNPYKFSVYRNAAYNWGSGAFAKISFDTEVFDTNNNFASSKYTAPVNGFYQFNARTYTSVGSGGNAYIISIYKNGVQYANGTGNIQGSGTSGFGLALSEFMQLTAGDYIEIYVYGNGNAGVTGTTGNMFAGFLVSQT